VGARSGGVLFRFILSQLNIGSEKAEFIKKHAELEERFEELSAMMSASFSHGPMLAAALSAAARTRVSIPQAHAILFGDDELLKSLDRE